MVCLGLVLLENMLTNNFKTTYSCQYRSCSARIHTSQAELCNHVINSHLTRVHLLCPINGQLDVLVKLFQS